MAKWNMPPLAKVYEALSAVADDRVKLTSDTSAEVLSSERDKTYAVKWSADWHSVTSNDNATRWQGYIGYPIIAVLLQTGRIPYDASVGVPLVRAPWHALNEQFKRDYDAAIEHVLRQIGDHGWDVDAIRRDAQRIYGELEQLQLEKPEPKRPAASRSGSEKDGAGA